jgi:hypothetical protein
LLCGDASIGSFMLGPCQINFTLFLSVDSVHNETPENCFNGR